MASFGENEDSPAGFSDNENDQDETMEDADEGDADNAREETTMMEDDNDDNEGDDDADENANSYEGTPSRARSAPGTDRPAGSGPQANGERSTASNDDRTREYKTPEREQPSSHAASPTAAPSKPFTARVRQDMIDAAFYDIAPTIAAPHSTSINTVTATPDMRWVFSGGADGWIRKFNWIDTVNAKSMLTVAQRHPFVDSVVKAGVLMSYWENEEPSDDKEITNTPKPPEEALPLSPVYSLAVHPQALWLLSGTEVGAINLQSVRHEEGKRITSLFKHSSAVSVMSLLSDNRTLISGSWDKTILEWDLNVGQVKRNYNGSRSQISALEFRPSSAAPIPRDTLEQPMLDATSDALGSGRDTQDAPATAKGAAAQSSEKPHDSNNTTSNTKSPGGSLFGDTADNDSLFGEDAAPSNGALAFDDDDEFSRMIAEGAKQQEALDADGDTGMGATQRAEPTAAHPTADPATDAQTNGVSSIDIPDPNADPNSEPDATAKNEPPSTLDAPTTQSHQNGSIPAPTSAPTSAPTAVLLDDPSIPSTGPSANAGTSAHQHESIFLDAAIDGMLRVWDRRQPNPIARMAPPRSVPPWCMHACWSPDGNYIYAGRRNGTVDEYSVHAGLRAPTRSLKFPAGSGAVSAVRAMPNGRHLVCASFDILRLYDLKDEESFKHANVPFLIVPGHRTGVVSHLYIDPTCSFMISTGGNRGWEGSSTEVLLGYEIGFGR